MSKDEINRKHKTNRLTQEESQIFNRIEQAITEYDVIDFEARLKNSSGSRLAFKGKRFNIAAALVAFAMISASLFYIGMPKNKKLFNKYYSIENIEANIGNYRDGESIKTAAINFLLAQKYDLAAVELQKYLTETPDDFQARLLYGISLIETNQMVAAITQFKHIIEAPLNFYTDDALWYRSLVFIKMKKYPEAKNYLTKIEPASEYYPPALSLLDKIKKEN